MKKLKGLTSLIVLTCLIVIGPTVYQKQEAYAGKRICQGRKSVAGPIFRCKRNGVGCKKQCGPFEKL